LPLTVSVGNNHLRVAMRVVISLLRSSLRSLTRTAG
jgi:hypothetical protein